MYDEKEAQTYGRMANLKPVFNRAGVYIYNTNQGIVALQVIYVTVIPHL